MDKDIDNLAKILADADIRREVIEFLAKDFSKDFLAPVRMSFEESIAIPVSCKEWQE